MVDWEIMILKTEIYRFYQRFWGFWTVSIHMETKNDNFFCIVLSN